ncbi:uncharacterized protein LOC108440881 isoform X1 [Pygocentrus nattereri]|uniref:uncharacterized protein LOC108440881 isoform X1 n=2 Tax=Pygocentrus nattereri TaxID=42514 RepID=UPI0008143338|nr:uncharacterized protein LOC108440881 isoform X1 [Pygocentrus nattereri]
MSLFSSNQQMQNNNARRRKPPPSFIKNRENNRESLKTCGMLLIQTMMMRITREGQGSKKLCLYMDEMLHSIFFLGYIHQDRLIPDDFFEISTAQQDMCNMFPGPFRKYNSHLPTRTPFSILLDMMEMLYSTERIKEELLHLLKEMKFPNPLHKPGSKPEQYYTLESTVICECSDSDSQKHYGASLCCRKGAAKKILIDLSCLKTWHKYVSHAVMSFSSGAGDGITFPESLRCQAYVRNWKTNVYEERNPCFNCGNLFNLQDADLDKVEYPFGNCAETECLSKLLINNQYMHENAVINNHTEENVEELRSSTKAHLIEQLVKVGIKVNDNNLLFYSPFQMQTGD